MKYSPPFPDTSHDVTGSDVISATMSPEVRTKSCRYTELSGMAFRYNTPVFFNASKIHKKKNIAK